MKIRAFLVTTDGRTDPIRDYMALNEPAMGAGAWTSYHYAPDATTGVVFVRYDESAFNSSSLTALAGVELVAPETADRLYPETAKAKRDSVHAMIERRGGGWDNSKARTWEDAVVELMRRNGSPHQTALRSSPAARTRQFLDETG